MYLPVLPAVTTSEITISGDVTIDDSAVIAPGVILQAAKGSKIVIGAGACIGMGSILKAYQGTTIEVKDNAVLGAGVLVIGECKIESKVCVGTSTTIYNTSIESGKIINAGSILGDPTRSFKESFNSNSASNSSSPVLERKPEKEEKKGTATFNSHNSKVSPEKDTKTNSEVNKQEENVLKETTEIDAQPEEEWQVSKNNENSVTEDPWQPTSKNVNENPVVGQVYINKLLFTLFPDKQPKNK